MHWQKSLSYLKLSRYIKSKWLQWPVRILLWIIVYIFILQTNFLWLTGHIPTIDEIKNPQVALASDLYTADSVLIGRFYTENRTHVTYENMSPWLSKALIATEDVRFYKHNGLDVFAVFSSLWQTAKGDNRGGSTITQQIVKNIFKTRSASKQGILSKVPFLRTIIIKSKEWITAIRLEFYFSKKQILELYFNTVDFGNNWYGIQVASNNYFNTQPAQLKIEQASLLIGMLKATTTYNPRKYPERAIERRNVVLAQLLKYGEINNHDYDSLRLLPLEIQPAGEKRVSEDDSYIRRYVESRINDWSTANGLNIYADGLKIYTTINSKLQKLAEAAVSEQLRKLQQVFYSQWGNQNPWIDDDGKEIPDFLESQLKATSQYKELVKQFGSNTDTIEFLLKQPKKMKVFTWNGSRDTMFSVYDSLSYYAKILQAGFMCWDPFTGHIVAYVGGNDHAFFKYDKVSQSRRQAGSTFKPFAYLAAIDKGCDPCDVFEDKPVVIRYKENGKDMVWQPHNSTYNFSYEHKTLRRALAQSCNSITAQLTEIIGWNSVIDYAYRCGIKSKLQNVPSICLGSTDVSVYEMANAYGTILNNGNRCEPIIVSRICDRDGNEIATFKPQFEKVLSDETCFLMQTMLLATMEEPDGTSLGLWSYKLFNDQNRVGGKTGTTTNNSDAWYIGLSKNLVTAIWTGTDFRSIHLKGDAGQGSRVALPIFGRFMENAIASKSSLVQTGRWPKPNKKVKRQYENCTGNSAIKADSITTDTMQLNLQIDSVNMVPGLQNN